MMHETPATGAARYLFLLSHQARPPSPVVSRRSVSGLGIGRGAGPASAAPVSRRTAPSAARSTSLAQNAHRLTAEKGFDVFPGLPVEDPIGLLGDVAEMRGNDRIRKRAKRVVQGQRLRAENIQSRAGDGAVAEGANERGFVHDGAARRIHEIGAALH